MRRLRALVIMMTGAGLIAGVPVRDAQACDDDRYPCPVREQAAAQETATALANPSPSTQPKKKANHTRANAKASAKGEREAPSATARANVSKPAVQEQAADPISQKAAEAAPAAVPSSPANSPLNDESQGESLVTTAGTAWPVSPNTESAGDNAGATAANAAKAASNVVQVIDPNQTNDVDRVNLGRSARCGVGHHTVLFGNEIRRPAVQGAQPSRLGGGQRALRANAIRAVGR